MSAEFVAEVVRASARLIELPPGLRLTDCDRCTGWTLDVLTYQARRAKTGARLVWVSFRTIRDECVGLPVLRFAEMGRLHLHSETPRYHAAEAAAVGWMCHRLQTCPGCRDAGECPQHGAYIRFDLGRVRPRLGVGNR